jgi:enoyl-CoA hydratase/carnithine racemase
VTHPDVGAVIPTLISSRYHLHTIHTDGNAFAVGSRFSPELATRVTRVVSHERLLDETELIAHQILRNSQRAVRSARETILEAISVPLCGPSR